jgi:hypothetical protein
METDPEAAGLPFSGTLKNKANVLVLPGLMGPSK